MSMWKRDSRVVVEHPSADAVLAECRRYEDDAHRRLGDLDQKASLLVGASLTTVVLITGAFAKAASSDDLLARECLWWVAMAAFGLALVLAIIAVVLGLMGVTPTTVRYVTDEALSDLTTPKAMSEKLYVTAGPLAATSLANGRRAHAAASDKADRVAGSAIVLSVAVSITPFVGILVAAASWLER